MPTIGEVVDKEMHDENERLKERLVKYETALRNLVAAAYPVDSDAKANYQKEYGGMVYTCMIRAKDMDKFLAAVTTAKEVLK